MRLIGWVWIASAIVACVGLAAWAASGGRFLVVEGGSMLPALRPGDMLIVGRYGADSLRRGDIVTFRSRRVAGSVTHRVVKAQGRGAGLRLLTKGDANARADWMISRGTDVEGKVVAAVPKAGLAVRLLRTPAGFAAGVALPALVLLFRYGRSAAAALNVRRHTSAG